ncbi:MAG: T9SS type A sorting domain-containing protein [Polaribacter sp.]|uniref:T9SS type A sorting domain-containing protein n=1 Tax=Polaribacter sp. TaxID=1920175 RepID=UPI003EF948E8
MKLKLLILFAFIAVTNAFSQITIHNVDGCRKMPLTETGNGLAVTRITANPSAIGHTATNVTLLTPSANTSGNAKFNLPFPIQADDEFTLKFKMYSDAAGADGSGSGQLQVRFFNQAAGIDGGSSYHSVNFDKTDGPTVGWQQISSTITITNRSASGVALSTFDAIQILPVLSAVTTADVYIDDFTIEDTIPIVADPESDLLTNNVWYYDNSPDIINFTKGTGGGTFTIENSPNTTENSSPTVMQFLRYGGKHPYHTFAHGDIPATGTVKVRIYPVCMNTELSPTLRFQMQDTHNSVSIWTVIYLTEGIWNDVEIDLSTLTSGTASVDGLYNQTEFRFDAGNNTTAANAIYYVDAYQGPVGSTTFTKDANVKWSAAGNWSTVKPNAAVNAVIPAGETVVLGVNDREEVNDLSVDGAGSLQVNVGGSLIVHGSSVGNVIYKRTLTFKAGDANGWHLISSPVVGQAYNDAYATTSDLATSTTDNTKRGLATFNDANDPKFDYLLTTDANAGTFTSGIGYSAKSASGGQIIFEGTINTADVNSVAVSASADGFELLGVPYTSYMSSKTFLEANTNLDQSQIWVWEQGDPTGGNYVAEIAVNDFKLAPGQGFFVKKANTDATVDFAKSNQLGDGLSDTFKKSSRTEVKLLITDGESNRFAQLYYVNNVTKGFDSGWEGEVFGGIKNNLDVFSQLVEDNQGKNYQVQSLPLSEMESMIVSLGITAAANKEITFSVESLNLPEGVNVILEDRAENIFTNLDESDYKITLTEAVDGVGRFYLHTSTSSSVLSLDAELLKSVSIFKTTNNNLRIAGLSQGDAKVSVFNILGKKVYSSSFSVDATVKDIALSNLATGVYIVQLQTEAGKLNKKIIME